jgi:hypothetical protein
MSEVPLQAPSHACTCTLEVHRVEGQKEALSLSLTHTLPLTHAHTHSHSLTLTHTAFLQDAFQCPPMVADKRSYMT